MAKELIINATLPEVRIALMDDGQIQELLIERESEKGIVGNIYKGRVTRVLPGMQAAFVDVGLDKAAFLYVDDIYVHPEVMGEETEVSSEESHEDSSEDSTRESSEESSDDAAFEIETGEEHSESEESSEESEDSMLEDSMDADLDDSSDDATDDSGDDSGGEEVDEEGDEEGDPSSDQDSLDASSESHSDSEQSLSGESAGEEGQANSEGGLERLQGQGGRRGRRGRNRNRRRRGGQGSQGGRNQFAGGESHEDPANIPEAVNENLNDEGLMESDRAAMGGDAAPQGNKGANKGAPRKARPEFREQRGRDRRIKSKNFRPRAQANISDLLKEGQEVIVQVAKDPIATKGARLTCHVSLPGRHLVCMPSIDHVGVSRRIEREDERRRLRDFVERNRPRKMGFIVRTASGGKDPESWIKQDIDYLSKLWTGIRTKSDEVSAPSLVYEDLTSILRAIRDWVNEDIDRIVVDTRYHYNELMGFAERFMPSLGEKIELYQGDIPIFDAYGLSSELTRSLERKVWLKSGGYIVIDQAEALVAVDVNTGRFVGKKNLEDTILKTNLEAAEEIAYQLRLRNCGGIIIVDFIDMEREDNKMRVYRALDEALKKDRARPTIQKISELGLVEMTRKRTRDTLVRSLCEPCTHCEGRGYTKSHSTVAYEILREVERLSVDRDAKKVLISAHESVINILAIELRDALDQLERRYNKSVYLQTVMEFHAEQFEVVTDRVQAKKPGQDIARQLRIERERTERREKGKQRKEHQSRDRSDRNQDRNPDRNPERQADRHAERNSERNSERPVEATSAPARHVPDVRPSGSFIAPKAAAPQPQIQEAPANDGEVSALEPKVDGVEHPVDFAGSEDQGTRNPTPDFSDMDDEDQLAYLRAQAAQDAAIAGLKGATQGAPAPGNPRFNRGQNPRGAQPGGGNANGSGNRNPRAQNQNRGGRNQQQRGGGNPQGGGNRGNPQNSGNQRFRPQSNGNAVQTMEARPRTPEAVTEASDFEVLNRSGDGSES